MTYDGLCCRKQRIWLTFFGGTTPIKGEVDSIARGIGDTQNPTGSNLLQNVNPIFEWVRLAQRNSVRIKLIRVPKETILSSGMTVTASIIQETNSKQAGMAESSDPEFSAGHFWSPRSVN